MSEKPGSGTGLTRRQELQLAAAAAVHAAAQAADPEASARQAQNLAALRESLARLLETPEQDLDVTDDIEQPAAAVSG